LTVLSLLYHHASQFTGTSYRLRHQPAAENWILPFLGYEPRVIS